MNKVKLSEFQKKSSQMIDEVVEQARTIVLTKEGVPVGQLMPYVDRPDTLFGYLRGSVVVKGDIISPVLSIGKKK